MMSSKDYYKILEVDRGASEDRIRKAYRRLALQYHPDRNQGDPQAEERFKEIAEAYGVLIDPVKRSQYDQWHGAKAHHAGPAGEGFAYTQEEILRDVFKDPRFNSVFRELFKEFERAGVRFDKQFVDRTFFGGRGIVFGGVFFWGSFPSGIDLGRLLSHGRKRHETLDKAERGEELHAPGFLKRLGRTIGGYLGGEPKAVPERITKSAQDALDITYHLTVTSEEARQGKVVTISVDHGEGRETLKVNVPSGIRSGTRLRLKGKGARRDGMRGNLFIAVQVV